MADCSVGREHALRSSVTELGEVVGAMILHGSQNRLRREFVQDYHDRFAESHAAPISTPISTFTQTALERTRACPGGWSLSPGARSDLQTI
jgi:hypothetical protein